MSRSRPLLPRGAFPRISASGVLILLAVAVFAVTRGILIALHVAGTILAALLAPMATRPASAPARAAPRRAAPRR